MSPIALRRALLTASVLAILASPVLARADEAATAALGGETRNWVDLQTSGSAASTEARPLPGDIADKVYQRYADSFAQPIPETLRRDSFVEGGGSGSGGGGGGN